MLILLAPWVRIWTMGFDGAWRAGAPRSAAAERDCFVAEIGKRKRKESATICPTKLK
jgi:hypothetical protein